MFFNCAVKCYIYYFAFITKELQIRRGGKLGTIKTESETNIILFVLLLLLFALPLTR